MTEPLYKLRRKEEKFEWSRETERAFKEEKKNEELKLIISDIEKKFTSETDASKIGLDPVLEKEEQAVAYIPSFLSRAERNYGITKKEVLAAL